MFKCPTLFKVDRLQIIVVAKNITVLQLFISGMPKMRAIPQDLRICLSNAPRKEQSSSAPVIFNEASV